MTLRLRPRFAGLAACAAALVIGSGCGGGGVPSGYTVSPDANLMLVKGTVKIQGKPASAGTVEFKLADGERWTAPIGKGGTYSLKSTKGAAEISVIAPEISRNPRLAGLALHYDVQRGGNIFDIEIPPRGH